MDTSGDFERVVLPVPDDLKLPLFKLAEEGNIFDIEKFIRVHGEQTNPFQLDSQSKRAVRRVIELAFYELEANPTEFDCSRLKILKSAGLLTSSSLEEELMSFLKRRSEYQPVERARLLRNIQGRSDLASEEELRTVIASKVKEALGWDVSL